MIALFNAIAVCDNDTPKIAVFDWLYNGFVAIPKIIHFFNNHFCPLKFSFDSLYNIGPFHIPFVSKKNLYKIQDGELINLGHSVDLDS